jgi:hypothetical protein
MWVLLCEHLPRFIWIFIRFVNLFQKQFFLSIFLKRTPNMRNILSGSLKCFFLIRIIGGGVHTGSTRHVGHFWPIVPAPDDCEDGEFGGMKIGRGNRSTWRKPATATLCPSQIPFDQTRARSRAAAVGSQRLTASAMMQPYRLHSNTK